jgi:type IV secretory pathway VirB10-like protein
MRTAPKIAVLLGALILVTVAVGVKMSVSRPKATEPYLAPAEDPKAPEKPVPAPTPRPTRPPVVDASIPPAAPPVPKKAATSKPKTLSEPELMERLRKAQDTDEYQLSYDLAREGLRRFPDSSDAPEMAAMVVKSLARQGKASEARAEAEEMVNKYAGTSWAREVERHTGAHPHVNQVPPK